MPNHVMNRLRLEGDQKRINELFESVKSVDSILDFNKIIPMPNSLDIEAGSRTNKGLAAYRDFISVYTFDGAKNNPDLLNIPEKSEKAFLKQRKDVDVEELKIGKIAFQNQIKYGAATWYEWHINNWGTKWSAYNAEIGVDNTLIFNTAWSRAMPIIQKLAESFPDLKLDYKWADEDLGVNVGTAEFENGEIISDEFLQPQSKEAYEFAAELWGIDLAEEGFVFDEKSQTYEYRDNEQNQSPKME